MKLLFGNEWVRRDVYMRARLFLACAVAQSSVADTTLVLPGVNYNDLEQPNTVLDTVELRTLFTQLLDAITLAQTYPLASRGPLTSPGARKEVITTLRKLARAVAYALVEDLNLLVVNKDDVDARTE